ncbi:MAG: phosphogluconate dehydrogenase (NAD(+)-dependent, decarboxylating) [Acidimicrobiales bacterium]|jgi:6-phosphogluconate dehydrogenase
MQLGMVGLGRMGSDLVRRAMAADHECVVTDLDPNKISELEGEGAVGAADFAGLASKMSSPRAVWVMVPAAVVDRVIDGLAPFLEPGDIVIDGGNSNYRDDIARSERLAPTGLRYMDIGTSGGVHGLKRGFCLMVGGDDEAVEHLAPVLSAISPGVNAAPRTPGRTGEPAPEEHGWLHCGPVGAGHFVKMVHNGIEYGMMQAYAEGLAILERANLGRAYVEADAETAPMREPAFYQYDIDVPAVTEVWRRGAVVGSWLLDLTASAMHEDPGLGAFEGRVSDSGMGRWTAEAAIDLGVPASVITAALHSRFASRDQGDYGNKVLSAMRSQFGGHHEKKA